MINRNNKGGALSEMSITVGLVSVICITTVAVLSGNLQRVYQVAADYVSSINSNTPIRPAPDRPSPPGSPLPPVTTPPEETPPPSSPELRFTIDASHQAGLVSGFITGTHAVTKGEINFTIDWGDGTAPEVKTADGNYTHYYPDAGIYDVTVSGRLESSIMFGPGSQTISKVDSFGDIGINSIKSAFVESFPKLTYVASPPATVTSLHATFAGNANPPDVSHWDVSSVTDMSAMFDRSTNFNSDISGWNVSNVKKFIQMFSSVNELDQDFSSWDFSGLENGGLNGFMDNSRPTQKSVISALSTLKDTIPVNYDNGMTFGNANIPWSHAADMQALITRAPQLQWILYMDGPPPAGYEAYSHLRYR